MCRRRAADTNRYAKLPRWVYSVTVTVFRLDRADRRQLRNP